MSHEAVLLRQDIGRVLTLATLAEQLGTEYSYFEATDFSSQPGKLNAAGTYCSLDRIFSAGDNSTSAALWSRKYPVHDFRSRVFYQTEGIPVPAESSASRITDAATTPFEMLGFDIFMPYESVTMENGDNYMEKWRPEDPDDVLIACYRTFISLYSIFTNFESGGMEIVPIIYNYPSQEFTRIQSPGIVLPLLTVDALKIIKQSMLASQPRNPNDFPLSVIPKNLLSSKNRLAGKKSGIIHGLSGTDIKITWG